MIGDRTRAGLAAAKKRGVKLGGLNAKGIAEQRAARERAEQLRPLFAELADKPILQGLQEFVWIDVATGPGSRRYGPFSNISLLDVLIANKCD